MTTLAALKFNTADGAEQTLAKVQDLGKQHLIILIDAAIVTWPEGKKKPKTKQLHNMTGFGALEGAFWGMLFGLIFFVPLFGAAVGVAMGALTGHFTDVGINDDFIKSVRDQVTEGTSALFLMTTDATQDKVAEAFKGLECEVISTNLSKEQEEKLNEIFAHEEA